MNTPQVDRRETLASRAPTRGTWYPCDELSKAVSDLVRERGMAKAEELLCLPAATVAKIAAGSCPLRWSTIEATHARLSATLGPGYMRRA